MSFTSILVIAQLLGLFSVLCKYLAEREPSRQSKIHNWLADLVQSHWIPRKDYDERLRELEYATMEQNKARREYDILRNNFCDLRNDWGRARTLAALLIDRKFHIIPSIQELRDRHQVFVGVHVDVEVFDAQRQRAEFIRNLAHAITNHLADKILIPRDKEKELKFARDWREIMNEYSPDSLGSYEATIEAKYQELIYAVGQKHPGETRHQTALRYIQQAEEGSNEADQEQRA